MTEAVAQSHWVGHDPPLSENDALQVAEFLNRFQSFYLPPNNNNNNNKRHLGIITPADIQTICNAQSLDDPRLACICDLWNRSTVWNAKALAQQFLVTPPNVAAKFFNKRTQPPSSQSTPLSMPRGHNLRSSGKTFHYEEMEDDSNDDDDDDYEEGDTSQDDDDDLEPDDSMSVASSQGKKRSRSNSSEEEHHGSHKRRKSDNSLGHKPDPDDLKLDALVLNHSHLYFSTLLQLPLSSYVQDVLPPIKNNTMTQQHRDDNSKLPRFAQLFDQRYNHPSEDDLEATPSLSLSPNHWTWPEHAKIIHWLANLPESLRSAVYTSPYGAGEMRIPLGATRTIKHIPKALYYDRTWTKADLVALAVRAQRNTEARRHLLQLFEYHTTANKSRAAFQGNHKHVWTRSIQTTQHLKVLQTNVVANQIAAAPLVYRFLEDHTSQQSVPSPPSDYRPDHTPTRSASTEQPTEWQTHSLVQDVYSALLRGCAATHGRDLAPLLAPRLAERTVLHREGLFPNALWSDAALESITEPLREHWGNLPRVDRLIGLGKYKQPNSFDTLVRSMVDAMIAAYKTYAATDNADTTTNADDFGQALTRKLQRDFFEPLQRFDTTTKDVGVVEAALALVDGSSFATRPSFTELQELFKTVPTPWAAKCAQCKKPLVPKNASADDVVPLRKCGACHAHYHLNACGAQGQEKTIQSFLELLPQLAQLFQVEPPRPGSAKDSHGNPLMVPFYRDDHNKNKVTWTEMTITVNRQVRAGELQRYGAGVCHMHVCNKAAERLQSATINAWELEAVAERLDVGLSLEERFDDCFIVQVLTPGDAADAAGLQQNDVITAIEFVEFYSNDNEQNKGFQVGQQYQVKEVPLEHRFNLLKTTATEMIVTIYRPNQPLFDQANEVKAYLEQKYALYSTVSQHAVWFCANCCQSREPPVASTTPTLWQAQCCRAVIRHLANQWYGSSLWHEQIEICPEEMESGAFHDRCTSLSRLDLMMNGIIAKHEGQDTNAAAYMHYGVTVGSERVGWAPEGMENNPPALLCLGVKRLLDGIEEDSVREALLDDFSKVFCAWVLASQPQDSPAKSPGPYLQALHAVRPDKNRSLCQKCLVRPLPQDAHLCRVCRDLQSPEFQKLRPTSQSRAPSQLAQKKRLYEQRANLVGKVVLLMPDSARLYELTKILEKFAIPVEHCNRPIELLIGSYFPTGLFPSSESADNQIDPAAGTFHVIPIVGDAQVGFLTSLAESRRVGTKLTAELVQQWRNEKLMSLDGVLQMRFDEVSSLLAQTKSIVEAAETAVLHQTRCLCQAEAKHARNDKERHKAVVCTKETCGVPNRLDRLDNCNPKILLTDDIALSPLFQAMQSDSGSGDDQDSGDEQETDDQDAHPGIAQPFEEVPRIQTRSYFAAPNSRNVVYTDLYFTSEATRDQFVKESPPLSPIPDHEPSTLMFVLERPQEINAQYPELGGHGVEIRQFHRNGNNIFLVNRINARGAAFKSGLRHGDEIVALNGTGIRQLESPVLLACALLNASFLSNVPKSAGLESSVSILRAAANKLQKPGSLVVTAKRAISKPAATISEVDLTLDDQIVANESDVVLDPQRRFLEHPNVRFKKLLVSLVKEAWSVTRTAADEGELAQLLFKRYNESTGRVLIIPNEGASPRLATLEECVGLFSRSVKKAISAIQQQQQQREQQERELLQEPPLQQEAEREQQQEEEREQQQTQEQPKVLKDTQFYPFVRSVLPSLAGLPDAPELGIRDLDTQGPSPLVFTIAETSVLATAIREKQIIMAIRLLLPRYSVTLIQQQIDAFRDADLSNLRKLPANGWLLLLRVDYERTKTEPPDAPYILQDTKKNYSLKFPTIRLPIDQLMEELMDSPINNNIEIIVSRFAEKIGRLPERVRGGGEEDEPTNKQTLKMLPKSEWHGKLVTGFARTQRNEGASDAKSKFLGRVVYDETMDDRRNSVNVWIVFLSCSGAISAFTQKFKAKSLFVVNQGSNDEQLVLRSERVQQKSFEELTKHISQAKQSDSSENTANKPTQKPAGVETGATGIETRATGALLNEGQEQRGKPSDTTGEPSEPAPMEAMGTQIEPRRATHAAEPGSPDALETQVGQKEKETATGGTVDSQETETINKETDAAPAEGSSLPCNVGEILNEKQFLGLLPDGRGVRWFPSDPNAIFVDSFNALGAVPLSRWSSLYSRHLELLVSKNSNQAGYLLPASENFACFWGCERANDGGPSKALGFPNRETLYEHLLDYHSFGAPYGSSFMRVGDEAGISSLIDSATKAFCTWVPIASELIVTDNKKSRFSETIFEEQNVENLFKEAAILPSPYRSFLKLLLRLTNRFPAEFCDLSAGRPVELPDNKMSVCSMGSEKIFRTESEDDEDDEEENEESIGLGCSQVGSVLFDGNHCFCNDHGSPLHVFRDLLLKVQASFPEAFLLSNSPFLEMDFREGWKLVVKEAGTVDSLLQALVCFLSSADLAKFPEWWKDKCFGWDVFSLLLLPSPAWSSMFLHLSAFDLALSEAIAFASEQPQYLSGQHVPLGLQELSFEQRVAATLQRAEKMGLKVWEGDYKRFCSVCLVGGELLCCELCSNTAHQSCYNLPEAPNKFVCHSCMEDLDAISQSDHS